MSRKCTTPRKKCIARKGSIRVFELPTGFFAVFKGREERFQTLNKGYALARMETVR